MVFNKKMIIVGGSGSGKDYLMNYLITKKANPLTKHTTRPKRDGEVNNADYYFVDKNTFEAKIDRGEFLTYEEFTVTPKDKEEELWYYGIDKRAFKYCDAAIMTAGELNALDTMIKNNRDEYLILYLDIDKEVRYKRLLNRNDDNDSIERRIEADEEDLKDFNDYDVKVTVDNFNPDDIYDLWKISYII